MSTDAAGVLVTRVVRTLGSGKYHVASVPAGLFGRYRWIGPWFTGIGLPLATECGVVLRGKKDVAVCMEAGTLVNCVPCRRLSGITEAAKDNGELPYGSPVYGMPDTGHDGGLPA